MGRKAWRGNGKDLGDISQVRLWMGILTGVSFERIVHDN